MNVVLNLVLVLQMVSALAMVGLILVQHGKGADMGAAFGSGASGSLFGASGSANFLSRATGVLATVFLASTLALAYFGFSVRSAPTGTGTSVLEQSTVVVPPASGASAAGAAAAIPSGASPVGSAAPAASVPATGAAQIPTK
ncbi:MAG: preprotein translocase subunit SecG [Proteobacteria bacterium]|jgi:preprotein translocase subunit SecG|nr:preprotein translocase subunit SecG [Pseudomonadota bacterium]